MFDLDGFKAYNDRFGHPVGRRAAGPPGPQPRRDRGRLRARLPPRRRRVLRGGLRRARASSRRWPSRAHAALRDTGRGFEITSSFGMVLVPDEAPDTEHALNLADERLYEHKGESRRTTVTKETSDALVAVLKECQPGLDGHLNEVATLARDVGTPDGHAARRARRDHPRRPAARHRQGGRAERHPRQARPARRGRVGLRAPAHPGRRPHPERRSGDVAAWPRSCAPHTSASTAPATPTAWPATRSRSAPGSSPCATPTTR